MATLVVLYDGINRPRVLRFEVTLYMWSPRLSNFLSKDPVGAFLANFLQQLLVALSCIVVVCDAKAATLHRMISVSVSRRMSPCLTISTLVGQKEFDVF